MKKQSTFLFIALVAFALLSVGAFAAGPKLQVLHSFSGGTDGYQPLATMVADAAGNLYGTTPAGGSNTLCLGGAYAGCGTVFKLTPPTKRGGAWKETILYRFSGADGAFPAAGLVMDKAGNFYGTTEEGGTFNGVCSNAFIDYGCGLVFELSPRAGGTWAETVLYEFVGQSDGASPVANLAFDASGNLYGTTQGGGAVGAGTVYELSPNGSQGWSETVLYQFQSGFDGAFPLAGVTLDQTGNLYGTTEAGGAIGPGTVFKLSPPQMQGGSWTENILYSFTASAGEPYGVLIFDKAGNLYGTTSWPKGNVFELIPSAGDSWTEIQLYAFGSTRISVPLAGLTLDNIGNLYGTATGDFCGGVFRLQPHSGSWNEAELDFFTGHDGPCGPSASLTFGKFSGVYGTTAGGGESNLGSVFAIYLN